VNILYSLGIFEAIADAASPLVTTVLGLPKESVTALAIGFLRKDVALGMMAPLNMTPGQLVVGSVVLAMFFPCIATFVVLLREIGWSGLLKSMGVMLIAALGTGGILNLILN
jgi:ferrous iron transport protein B